jgi:hypothetical protein
LNPATNVAVGWASAISSWFVSVISGSRRTVVDVVVAGRAASGEGSTLEV